MTVCVAVRCVNGCLVGAVVPVRAVEVVAGDYLVEVVTDYIGANNRFFKVFCSPEVEAKNKKTKTKQKAYNPLFIKLVACY